MVKPQWHFVLAILLVVKQLMDSTTYHQWDKISVVHTDLELLVVVVKKAILSHLIPQNV